ncbi:MAG: PadR family transcriptional regulator [Desulfomonilaceae bacterium]
MTSRHLNIVKAETSRNPAEYPVLGILSLGEAHGYDICLRLRKGIGSIWRLGKSQVYALLGRLEREGLVAHERVGQENLPARNIFSITPMGEEVFRKWVITPINHVRDMRLELLTKLWFARQVDPDHERTLIEQQLAVCREKVKRLEALKASCSTEIESRSIGFRLTVVHATVSWLEELLVQTINYPS